MKTYVSIYYGFDFETPLYQYENEANRFIKESFEKELKLELYSIIYSQCDNGNGMLRH